MSSTSHPSRVARLAAGVVSLVILTVPFPSVADDRHGLNAGGARNSGVAPDWMPHDPPANWRRLMNEVVTNPTTGSRHDDAARSGSPDRPHLAGSHVASAPSIVTDPSTEDGSLEYAQIGLGGFAGAMFVAVVAGILSGRRRRQPQLEAALDDPDELPRAAGLLGDLFIQQSQADAAAHAYRAAIDVNDQYWSPIAQVALARLLSDRGHREEARALLETAIASGHPCTTSLAQAALSEFSTGEATQAAITSSPDVYEALTGPAHTRRSESASVDPPSSVSGT